FVLIRWAAGGRGKKERGSHAAIPRRLLGEYPAERLLGGADRDAIYLACAAAGNPVGTIRSTAATVDLDGVTGGRFAGVAIAGRGVLIVVSVATAGRHEVIRMTSRPRRGAGALDYFRKCLSLRCGSCRKELRKVAHSINLYLREADRTVWLYSILDRLRARVPLIEICIHSRRQGDKHLRILGSA